MILKAFLIVICILNTPLQAARILSIFAVPEPFQYALIEPLLKELAGRGHQITSITNYPQKIPVENFRDVVVKENQQLFDGYKNFTLDNIDINFYDFVEAYYNRAFQMCCNIFENPTVHNMFATENFDLIILEVLFTESFVGLAEYFQAPIVGVSVLGTMTSIDALVGNISPISYIPNMVLSLREMNFWKRFLNLMVHTTEWAHYYLKYMPLQKKIYEKYFPTAKLSFEEAQKNFALVLVNDHFSLTMPRPYVPNMIEVAGIHINTNPQPIPLALKQILDQAMNGVIYMEIDFIVSSKQREIFIQLFKSLKQIVVWKTSLEIPNAPSNVYTNSNYSQTSILAHPHTKLFISNGGYLNIVESIYHGLPILGLTAENSAEDYVDFIKKIGPGITIKQKNISYKTLSKAFDEILLSRYYSDMAQNLSKIFRDQQNTPMERAVFWIEYLLRHNGAAHLRNLGQNLTWYQFYNIDVLILLFCIIFLLIYLPYFFIKIATKLLYKILYKIT